LEQVRNPVLSADEVSLLQTVAAHYDAAEAHWGELERFCEGVPRTLVHGDFAIKNLRVRPGVSGPALLVYDWEMAGWGFPATDLAQIRKCARVDLDAYHSVMRQDLPDLSVCDIQWLADYGDLLRVVDNIFWATFSWVPPPGARDPYRFLAKPLLLLKKYEPQLAAALRAVNWS
jgi:hypothetical protein